MSEADWLGCDDPERLVDWLTTVTLCSACGERKGMWFDPCVGCGSRNYAPMLSDRKQRLVGCACCRSAWGLLPSEAQERAVEAAERFAEGRAERDAMRRAWQGSSPPGSAAASQYAFEACGVAKQLLGHARPLLRRLHGSRGLEGRMREVQLGLCEAIRDVAGYPLRPAAIAPGWLAAGSQVRAIAEGIHAEGRYGEVPVLGDALQDAGCDDAEILGHARRATHYRGCWLVDAILGKS